MIKAIWQIKVDKKVFKTGEVISGLNCKEEKRLIDLGAAVRVIEDVSQENDTDEVVLSPQLEVFKEVLSKMSLEEIKEYAKAGDIKTGRKGKDKSIDVLVQDAYENGIDIESFSEKDLLNFATMIDIDTTELTHEEVLNAVEAVFNKDE